MKVTKLPVKQSNNESGSIEANSGEYESLIRNETQWNVIINTNTVLQENTAQQLQYWL